MRLLASTVINNKNALDADGDRHTSICMWESKLCNECKVLLNMISSAGFTLCI